MNNKAFSDRVIFVGQMAEWSIATDCKSVAFGLRGFESLSAHTNINEAYQYWIEKLKVRLDQFYKPTVTISGKLGNYRNKSQYGVVTIYYGNTKLISKLVELLENFT